MHVTGLHHVSINVDNVAAAIDFYAGRLGLTQRDDRPDFGFGGAWLDAGSQQIHVIEAPPPPEVGQHLALAVDDLDAAVAELRSSGTEIGDPIPVGTGRQAFLHDPAGNLVELHEPAR